MGGGFLLGAAFGFGLYHWTGTPVGLLLLAISAVHGVVFLGVAWVPVAACLRWLTGEPQ
jgi:hypothetical protein